MRRYSFDNGKNWYEHKFSETPVKVKWLTTVPDSTTRKFLLFGKADDEYVAVQIDLTRLDAPQCTHACFITFFINACAGTADDFEYWVPPATDDQCILGHEVRLSFNPAFS